MGERREGLAKTLKYKVSFSWEVLILLRDITAALLCMAFALVAVSGRARAEWSTVQIGARASTNIPPQLLLAQRQQESGQSGTYKPPPRGAPEARASGATRDLRAQHRVALVIGNGAYQYLPRLANPTNDARLIAATLQSVGFELIGGNAQVDLDRAGFERAIREFGAALANASVGLFYYAGHGVQLQGMNYLVPVAANPITAADVDFELIDANTVLKQMELGGSTLNVVILDACRNNPFGGRGLRDAGGGLAQMQAPRGTLISYATQPGNVAIDGVTGHSPYTAALAETIREPGLPILEVFNQVGVAVDRATAGQQQPWVALSPLEGTFYFLGPTTVNIAPTPDPETVFWQTAAQGNNVTDYQEYLRQYPQGRFAGLAHNRLAALNPTPPTQEPTVQQHDVAPTLPPRPSSEPALAPANAPAIDAGETARVLETELRRVGCYIGPVSDKWGRAASEALRQFNRHSGTSFGVETASSDAITAVRARTGRVCPVVRRERLAPVARQEPVSLPPPSTAGPGPESPRSASPATVGKRCDTWAGQTFCE